MNFAVPADFRLKLKESEKKDLYLDLARGRKKTMEYESEADTNCNWGALYITIGLVLWLEYLETRRRVETIQATALLRLARKRRKDLET